MQGKSSHNGYRHDIDGLRAIAVLAVIIFHLGYLPGGFLGVDVFFVISGFLITRIIYKEAVDQRFSIAQFYLRRTRRIIPLLLVVDIAVLLLGCLFMLPDDLENLGQSVVATNFFGNNILQYITTGNYWDIVNEYKPMMHTWSLGIEEQFYLLYPFVFMIFVRRKANWILPVLLLISLVSLLAYLLPGAAGAAKFYLIPYRFFELSIGGIGAVCLKDKLLRHPATFIFTPLLLVLLCVPTGLPESITLCLSVVTALGMLISDNHNSPASYILENKVVVWIGKISFSLYMWHQLVFAFARYVFVQHFNLLAVALLLLIVFLLSAASYAFIEQPFRDKKKIGNKSLLWIVSVLFVFTTGAAFFLYAREGVIRNVPELDIAVSDVQQHMHSMYNDRIYKLDKNFTEKKKISILVIGNSFARDWANILLESKYKDTIEISYIYDISKSPDVRERLQQASYVFSSDMGKADFSKMTETYHMDTSKLWIVGIKRFGENNGIFYNRRWFGNYCQQRAALGQEVWEANEALKRDFGSRYIDLLALVTDEHKTVPVFTPDCKYISQDCRHLTQNGAAYFAQLLNDNRAFPLNR